MEHEIKRPLWKTSSFWLGIATVATTILSQLVHLLPANSPAIPYVGAAVAVGLSLQETAVRVSRNLASATVAAANAATSPLLLQKSDLDGFNIGAPLQSSELGVTDIANAG